MEESTCLEITENPYATPVATDPVLPQRRAFVDMPTRELNKLRNDSHSIRAIGGLAILAMLVTAGVFLFGAHFDTMGSSRVSAFLAYLGIASLMLIVALGLLKRPRWGRVLGFVAGGLMLLLFPIGSVIGVLFLISLARSGRLFGPERVVHNLLESEWRYRRKNRVE